MHEQAGSALRIYSNIARDVLPLLEASEATSEGGTQHEKDVTGSPASPHPSASEVPLYLSPYSPPCTTIKAQPELPKGENTLRTDSAKQQAKGYSVFPTVQQLLGHGEARYPSPQTALVPQETLDMMVCWWLQVFGSLHNLGKIMISFLFIHLLLSQSPSPNTAKVISTVTT